MRIIAGTLKGRRLDAPTWTGLRPTSDKLRETLFNVLAPRIAGARVLDLFAGTGALGIEAMSRGAASVTFVESHPRAARLIDANLSRCGIREGCAIIRASAHRAVESLISSSSSFVPFDIILLDPPYDHAPLEALRGVDTLLASDGVAVLEHARRTESPAASGRLELTRVLTSGDSALSFYSCQL
ncbi:MAG: 16S rRNA (guanine(966)-N(2))-methyltransferase RsmD [Acidobacteriaceae bacterium]|jgi:16S rRNA (guanine(966)-N(2))-methyltransferase RsmD|nr:16S rRNA (guanine(966)-N(2))-methyltransferase RsmD [Acidobacteriaceae bacterium]